MHSSSRGTNTSRASTRLGSQRLSFPGCGDQAVPQSGCPLPHPRAHPDPQAAYGTLQDLHWNLKTWLPLWVLMGRGQSRNFWKAGNVLHLHLVGDYTGDVYMVIKLYTHALYT